MKQKLLILGAVFFGILAAILTWTQISAERDAIMRNMEDVYLLEAATQINPGETIRKDQVTVVKVQRSVKDRRVNREIPQTQLNRIIGMKVKNEIKAREILLWTDIETPYDGNAGFSSKIPANASARAVTVLVDASSSVAGLIRPGDHVDIIGTFRFPDLKGDQALDTITLTVLQNVVVLATGTDYGQNLNSVTRGYNSLTLQLTATEAELIIFASQKGRLTFTLRSPQDTKTNKELNNINWDYLQKNIKDFATKREAMTKGLFN